MTSGENPTGNSICPWKSLASRERQMAFIVSVIGIATVPYTNGFHLLWASECRNETGTEVGKCCPARIANRPYTANPSVARTSLSNILGSL